MICPQCRVQGHPACASVDCTCGHQGSSVRPLTGRERHARVMGAHDDIVRPVDSRPGDSREVILIRPDSSSNGHHPAGETRA